MADNKSSSLLQGLFLNLFQTENRICEGFRAAVLFLWLVGSVFFYAPQGFAATPTPPVAKSYGLSQVEFINEQIRLGWKENDLVPSKLATDEEWCRRVYLDLVGRIPKISELEVYKKDRSSKKQKVLVDRLLGEEYEEEFAAHWTTIWTNILIGRTGGTGNNSLANRVGMKQYLRRSFLKEKPYNRMVEELVTATGSCRPGDKDFNGAANFLVDKMSENGVQATAKTSQIFLGMAVQCTQCHNHPFNDYKQNQFWEMNAFFRQSRVRRINDGDTRRQARMIERDFRGEGGDPEKAELYYELRNGKLKVAYPVFVNGKSLAEKYAEKSEDFGDNGMLSNINRRKELAKYMMESAMLDRAIVNRVWGQFLGHGFTSPVHDMGPHNPPTHPELLEELGEEFRQASYRLKTLMRWITLSEAYSLSSRTHKGNIKDDPSLGVRPSFSHFYLRQMQAEQLYESLITATEADQTLGYKEREQVKQRWLGQFNQAFGTDENDESTTFNGSIPQALMLMNGDLVKKATSKNKGSFLGKIARKEIKNSEKIQYLYLAALNRNPTRKEITRSSRLFKLYGGDAGSALQDIWWALMNSNEFIIIH